MRSCGLDRASSRTGLCNGMALVRCERCGVKPPGRGQYKRRYVGHVAPVGHPDSGLICGTPTCDQPGLIWLEGGEIQAYNGGRRVFSLQTNTTKVRAQ
jgi:hypothetical protein